MFDCLLQAAQILQTVDDNQEHTVPQMQKPKHRVSQRKMPQLSHHQQQQQQQQQLHSINDTPSIGHPMNPNTIIYYQQPPQNVVYNHSAQLHHQPHHHHQIPGPAVVYTAPSQGFNHPMHHQYDMATTHSSMAPAMHRIYTTPKIMRSRQNPGSMAQKKPVPIMLQKQPLGRNGAVMMQPLHVHHHQPSSFTSSSSNDEDQCSDGTDEDCSPGKDNKARNRSRSTNAHNEVEKRRRAYLTACYNDLHGILPTIAGTKASNATVLRSAVEHIKELELQDRKFILAKKEMFAQRKRILDRRNRASKATLALQKRRLEIQQGHAQPAPGPMSIHTTANSLKQFGGESTTTTITTISDEEGLEILVPDAYSRPVSPNLSPKEDLTLLGSPIKGKTSSSSACSSASSSPSSSPKPFSTSTIMMTPIHLTALH